MTYVRIRRGNLKDNEGGPWLTETGNNINNNNNSKGKHLWFYFFNILKNKFTNLTLKTI